VLHLRVMSSEQLNPYLGPHATEGRDRSSETTRRKCLALSKRGLEHCLDKLAESVQLRVEKARHQGRARILGASSDREGKRSAAGRCHSSSFGQGS
jgi:hypothetical protein